MTRLGRKVWWAILVVAGTGLLLSLVVLVRAPAETPPAQVTRGAAAVEVDPSVSPRGERAAVPTRSRAREDVRRTEASPPAVSRVVRPARVRVPGLGLDLAATPVGVSGDGQMRLPDDPRVLGWYRFGPAPGAGAGSAVLAGHVDSREYGVGPLARLGGIRAGARVEVVLATGRRTTYRVDSVERFDRQALPDGVFTRTGPERLRLVTCTGPYLPEAGGYQQNLVVTAVPV